MAGTMETTMTITVEQWKQAWQSRRCIECGERTERRVGSGNRDAYACQSCGLVVWYDYDLTDAGRAVANGYGWAGAPFSDGTRPALRTNERYGAYRKDCWDCGRHVAITEKGLCVYCEARHFEMQMDAEPEREF